QSDNVALEDLDAGSDRLDAVVTDKNVGLNQIEENDLDIHAVGDYFFEEEIGGAVKKDNDDMLDEFNRALEAVIDDGTYDEISEKWFDESILEYNDSFGWMKNLIVKDICRDGFCLDQEAVPASLLV